MFRVLVFSSTYIFIFAACSNDDVNPVRSSGDYVSNIDVCLPSNDLPDTLISDQVPDNRFNARIRLSPEVEARWDKSLNHLMGRALDKWESVILQRPTNDTPLTGVPLPGLMSFAEFEVSDEEYFGEYELEILFVYQHNGPFAAAGAIPWTEMGNGHHMPFSLFTVNQEFFDLIESGRLTEQHIYLVLLHEFGHALGFSDKTPDKNLYPHNNFVGGRFGRTCSWTGPNALTGWNQMLAPEVPFSSIPLQSDCGHWDPDDNNWRRIEDIMFPSLNQITDNISLVTVGYFDDIGFSVDYENADEVLVPNWGVRPAGKITDLPFNLECGIDLNTLY